MSSSTPSAIQKEPVQKDGREVEWQLACTDLGSVSRWLTDHGTIDGLVLEPRSTLQIFDTYLDTDDWRIHRAGFALRIRSGSGKLQATLKSLYSASAEVADRREFSETLENSESDWIRQSIGPVGTRTHALSGARALLPLFEIRTSRQRFELRRGDEAQQLGQPALAANPVPAWETIRKNCMICSSPGVDWKPSCASSDRLSPHRFCGFGRRSRPYCALSVTRATWTSP